MYSQETQHRVPHTVIWQNPVLNTHLLFVANDVNVKALVRRTNVIRAVFSDSVTFRLINFFAFAEHVKRKRIYPLLKFVEFDGIRYIFHFITL